MSPQPLLYPQGSNLSFTEVWEQEMCTSAVGDKKCTDVTLRQMWTIGESQHRVSHRTLKRLEGTQQQEVGRKSWKSTSSRKSGK